MKPCQIDAKPDWNPRKHGKNKNTKNNKLMSGIRVKCCCSFKYLHLIEVDMSCYRWCNANRIRFTQAWKT